MNFVFKKPLRDLLLNDVLPEWRANVKRQVNIHNLGTKRALNKCVDFYFSTKPAKGVIDQDFVKKIARELDAPQKAIAACLRSGEALRCQFLVPSLIARNETPDKLSAPCEPEWLNPDREDSFLGEGDLDTAEIMIGLS